MLRIRLFRFLTLTLLLHWPRNVHSFAPPAFFSSTRLLQPSTCRSTAVTLLRCSLPPPPPPPPPRRQERESSGFPTARKKKSEEPQAGAWREDLGLGLRRLRTSRLREETGKKQAASLEKAKRNNRPPPPMLTRAEWVAAFEIHGAKDMRELGEQFIMAKEGEFVELELRWRSRGASNSEVKKRLGQAHKVRRGRRRRMANGERRRKEWRG
eukprot:759136-Hanusia_phi.AAC.3